MGAMKQLYLQLNDIHKSCKRATTCRGCPFHNPDATKIEDKCKLDGPPHEWRLQQ